MNDIKERVKKMIIKLLNIDELMDNQDIFDLGIVNSLFAMQLVLCIEKEFDITLEESDLTFENMKSVNNIVSLIESKTGAVV